MGLEVFPNNCSRKEVCFFGFMIAGESRRFLMEAVEERFCVHFAGVFGDEAVDDEVVVVGAAEVDFWVGWGFGDVGGGDGARNSFEGDFGLWETSEGADFVFEGFGGFCGGFELG